MNLFSLMKCVQSSTTLYHAREREPIGHEPVKNHSAKQGNGVVGMVVLDAALDDQVPRKQSGSLQCVEEGEGMFEVVDFGVER